MQHNTTLDVVLNEMHGVHTYMSRLSPDKHHTSLSAAGCLRQLYTKWFVNQGSQMLQYNQCGTGAIAIAEQCIKYLAIFHLRNRVGATQFINIAVVRHSSTYAVESVHYIQPTVFADHAMQYRTAYVISLQYTELIRQGEMSSPIMIGYSITDNQSYALISTVHELLTNITCPTHLLDDALQPEEDDSTSWFHW